MEKNFGSWFHHQHSQRLSNYLNYLGAPLEVGWESSHPTYMNPHTNELSIDGTFPTFSFSELPHSKAGQPNEPSNWFYSLPPCPEAFAPAMNSLPKEKLPLDQNEKCFRAGSPNVGTAGTQKKFLVFDQSGDQTTTLIYCSGLGTPVQCLASWNPKPPVANDPVKEDFGLKKYNFPHFGPFVGDECKDDNPRDELDSEMHEDTEELNALLYSDDENENGSDDDDELTSTGHSPSTMTKHDVQNWLEEGEEVANSVSPTKKRKLSHGDLDAPSPVNMPSLEKSYKLPEFKDDAESSCGNFEDQVSEDSNSSSSKKRSRKEKIRQTVSILQSIIPGGKGKDTILVIDGAINYLKSLKIKAKSLGLDAL